jgi:hypothetical protein
MIIRLSWKKISNHYCFQRLRAVAAILALIYFLYLFSTNFRLLNSSSDASFTTTNTTNTGNIKRNSSTLKNLQKFSSSSILNVAPPTNNPNSWYDWFKNSFQTVVDTADLRNFFAPADDLHSVFNDYHSNYQRMPPSGFEEWVNFAKDRRKTDMFVNF